MRGSVRDCIGLGHAERVKSFSARPLEQRDLQRGQI
jgi:hypothetical protein